MIGSTSALVVDLYRCLRNLLFQLLLPGRHGCRLKHWKSFCKSENILLTPSDSSELSSLEELPSLQEHFDET